MRVENNSTLNFKGITNTIDSKEGYALLKRVKPKNISKFAAELAKQEENPVNITFSFKEGANPNIARFIAKLSCNGETKTYKQGLFTSTMKFFEKTCKKADKFYKDLQEPEYDKDISWGERILYRVFGRI